MLTVYGVLKICDFGLAKDLSPLENIPGRTVLSYQIGTLGYKAPEVIDGDPYTNELDIWSLGCIIHWICTKKKWFVHFDGEADGKYYDRIRY